MKLITYLSLLLVVLFFTSSVFSQVNVKGWWQSNLYIWENASENQQYDFYQGLQFRVAPQNNPDLYFNTFLRVAYQGDPADWEERIYNLYLNWNINQNYRFRIGRQFLYWGVINGTMDAVQFSGRFLPKLQFHGVIGLDAPFDRALEVRDWDKGNLMGGYLSYQLPGRNSIEVSYFQKQRESELYWQQIGTTILGFLNNRLNYYLRLDYNLLSKDYQTLRGRLTYYIDRWSLSAEYNSQRPRIYEDSFFSIFKVNSHNQIRGSVNYRLNDYDFGVHLLHTVYDVHEVYILFKDNNDLRFVGSVSHRKYGSFGLIAQTGTGGENIGYFANLHYEFLPGLTAKFYNSYYNYERATTNISQDALAFMAGLGYRLKKRLILEGELQQSSNNLYKNDLRGLVRLTYLFNI